MILVTGATGTVGSELVKQLRASGAPLKVTASSSEKRAKAAAEGLNTVLFDYNRPETFTPALQGVEKLFLLSPPGATGLEAGLIDAAKNAAVKHIVKQSVIGAEGEGYIFAREHRAMEKLIEASGIPHTFLRSNGFMQNFASNFGQAIRDQGAFFLPQGDSRVSYVDVRDIAAVAAKILTEEEGHTNKAYTITGPEALSNYDVADKLSRVAGKKVNYVPGSDDDMRKAMKEMGAPEALIDRLIDLMHYYLGDKAARVSPDVERVTGRNPISFDKFAEDYASAFTSTAAAD